MRRAMSVVVLLALTGAPSPSQIVNGDFESGRNAGWVESSQGNYTLIGTGAFFASTEIQPAVNPRSGSWMGRIGGFSYEINALSQVVTLPNRTPLYLAFYTQTRSANTSECAGLWVGAKVSIVVNNQEVYSTYLCQYNDLMQWTSFYVDMSALAGQSVQIVFKAEAANSVWSFLYIDDVGVTSTTSVASDRSPPSSFELRQNYPNPFNPTTSIEFSLPRAGHATLQVFNLLGEEVARLVSEELPAGTHSARWDAGHFSGGVYFYRLQSGSYNETRKLVLVK